MHDIRPGDSFPWNKLSAAQDFLYTVKPWWARFGSKMRFHAISVPVPPEKRWGGMTSTDRDMNIYVDKNFALNASLEELAGSIEHELQYHVRDAWNRLTWLDEDDLKTYRNICLELEICSSIHQESWMLDSKAIHRICSLSMLFNSDQAERWSVTNPPSILERAWLPSKIHLPEGLSAEQYYRLLKQDEEQDDSSTPGQDEGQDDGDDDQEGQEGSQEAEEEHSDLPPEEGSETSNGDGDHEGDPSQSDQSDQHSDSEQDDSSEDSDQNGENHDDSEQEGAEQEDFGTGETEADSDLESNPQQEDGRNDNQAEDDQVDDSETEGDQDDTSNSGEDQLEDSESEGETSTELNDDTQDSYPGQDEGDAGDQAGPSGDQGDLTEGDAPNASPLEAIQELKRQDPDLQWWDLDSSQFIEEVDEDDIQEVQEIDVKEAEQELAEDIRENMSNSVVAGYGMQPGKAMIEWSQETRKRSGTDCWSQIARLVTKKCDSVQVKGASDLTYSVRNPNQPQFGPVLMGLTGYAPKIYVLVDVSGSMKRHMDTSMSNLTSIVNSVGMRYGSETVWIAADTSIQGVGSSLIFKQDDFMSKTNRGFGGTILDQIMDDLAKGKLRHQQKRYDRPDLLVVLTDSLFKWPWVEQFKPPKGIEVLVLSTTSMKDLEDRSFIDVPAWMIEGKTFIHVDE